LVGPTFSTATGKYLSGVLAPNGYIYFMPGRNGNVLKLDPATDNVTQIAASYGNALANGCILSPQGVIYTVPQTNSVIVKLDTSTDTLSTIPRPSVNVSSNLWCGAVLAADGKIYMVPNSCNAVLELDPATDAITTHVVYDTALRNQYLGAVLGPDGLVYGIPNESFQVMAFDPVSKTATFTSDGGYAYGGALGPNGTIYGTGFIVNTIPTFDTLDNTTETFTVVGRPLFNGGYWYGGGAIMALNGNVYITGNNTSGIFAKVTFPGTNTIDPNWVLSRQSNKF
jgi:streptogramin lyase